MMRKTRSLNTEYQDDSTGGDDMSDNPLGLVMTLRGSHSTSNSHKKHPQPTSSTGGSKINSIIGHGKRGGLGLFKTTPGKGWWKNNKKHNMEQHIPSPIPTIEELTGSSDSTNKPELRTDSDHDMPILPSPFGAAAYAHAPASLPERHSVVTSPNIGSSSTLAETAALQPQPAVSQITSTSTTTTDIPRQAVEEQTEKKVAPSTFPNDKRNKKGTFSSSVPSISPTPVSNSKSPRRSTDTELKKNSLGFAGPRSGSAIFLGASVFDPIYDIMPFPGTAAASSDESDIKSETTRSHASSESRFRPLLPSGEGYVPSAELHALPGEEEVEQNQQGKVEEEEEDDDLDAPTVHTKNSNDCSLPLPTRRPQPKGGVSRRPLSYPSATKAVLAKPWAHANKKKADSPPPRPIRNESSHMPQQSSLPSSLSPETNANNDQSPAKPMRNESSHISLASSAYYASSPRRPGDVLIPVRPGLSVLLRRAPEVQEAIRRGYYDTPMCPCCSNGLAVIANAAFLYCPLCEDITPMIGPVWTVANYPEQPESERHGLGLGMTWETMHQIEHEIQVNDNKRAANANNTADNAAATDPVQTYASGPTIKEGTDKY